MSTELDIIAARAELLSIVRPKLPLEEEDLFQSPGVATSVADSLECAASYPVPTSPIDRSNNPMAQNMSTINPKPTSDHAEHHHGKETSTLAIESSLFCPSIVNAKILFDPPASRPTEESSFPSSFRHRYPGFLVRRASCGSLDHSRIHRLKRPLTKV